MKFIDNMVTGAKGLLGAAVLTASGCATPELGTSAGISGSSPVEIANEIRMEAIKHGRLARIHEGNGNSPQSRPSHVSNSSTSAIVAEKSDAQPAAPTRIADVPTARY